MTVSHDPLDQHPFPYVLDCLGCGNLIECSADSDDEAKADIGDHLLARIINKCAACRAMPAAR